MEAEYVETQKAMEEVQTVPSIYIDALQSVRDDERSCCCTIANFHFTVYMYIVVHVHVTIESNLTLFINLAHVGARLQYS